MAELSSKYVIKWTNVISMLFTLECPDTTSVMELDNNFKIGSSVDPLQVFLKHKVFSVEGR